MRTALLIFLLPCIAAAGSFQRLHSEQATATSFLKSNWNKYEENYHPSYVLDDDPKTAWVEGAEGDGIGESLTIPVSNLQSARAVRLVIFNGYQKSKGLLGANAAVKQLTVTVRGPGGRESGRKRLTLERKMGSQSFDIPVTGSVAEVLLTIDSVHPGSKYRDTCVSDVRIFVDSDVPYNAAVEKGKHEAMLRWKKERLDTAKYFASLPKTYPYAATRFERKTTGQLLSKRYAQVVDENKDGYAEKGVPAKDFVPLEVQIETGEIAGPLSDSDKALLVELAKLSASPPKNGRWYSLARQGRTVQPENVSIPTLMEPLFHLGDVTLFEAKGRGAIEPEVKDEEGYREGSALSNLLLLEGSATDVKKVYFTYTYFVAERTTTQSTTQALAIFEGGKLQRMVTLKTSEDDFEGNTLAAGVTTTTYSDGKVSRLESIELVGRDPEVDGPDPEAGISVEKTTLDAVTRS